MKLCKGKRASEIKWIYRVKHESNVASPRYKVILVVKFFKQRKCFDFNENLSRVVKTSSIRIMLSYVVNIDMEMKK